jgi:putative glutamine amidotransferase
MSSTPLVLVSTDNREFDGARWHVTPCQYSEAVLQGAKAIPVLLPSMGSLIDIDSVLGRVDGVLLSGARSNVHPSNYGVEPAPQYEPYDQERDATTLPLIRRALELGIPLFAICRGYQELNVALGGTLDTQIQTHDGRMDHYPYRGGNGSDERYALSHPVTVIREGCIGRILQDAEVTVNSLHLQGILEISPRLQVEALADDGTIEAVSVIGAKAFAVGVQWHPEYWVRSDAASSRLFEAFGDAVRAYAAGRSDQAMRLAAE